MEEEEGMEGREGGGREGGRRERGGRGEGGEGREEEHTDTRTCGGSKFYF